MCSKPLCAHLLGCKENLCGTPVESVQRVASMGFVLAMTTCPATVMTRLPSVGQANALPPRDKSQGAAPLDLSAGAGVPPWRPAE